MPDCQLTAIRSDLRVLRCLSGALLAVMVPALVLLLRIASKVGALAF